MRTPMQLAGDRAEAIAAARLQAGGWTLLGRNVRVGRDELDLVAVDPGPPPALVVTEVRWRVGREFGLPEETVDWRKQTRIRRAAIRLVTGGLLPDGEPLPALPLRLDVIAIEPAADDGNAEATIEVDDGLVRMRHYRSAFG